MKIKTSDLEDANLDWAVAYALNGTPVFAQAFGSKTIGRSIIRMVECGEIAPSRIWSQGGVLLEKYPWALPYRSTNRYHLGEFEACTPGGFPHNGSTPLIAAMRAIAAAELGSEVDVPDDIYQNLRK